MASISTILGTDAAATKKEAGIKPTLDVAKAAVSSAKASVSTLPNLEKTQRIPVQKAPVQKPAAPQAATTQAQKSTTPQAQAPAPAKSYGRPEMEQAYNAAIQKGMAKADADEAMASFDRGTSPEYLYNFFSKYSGDKAATQQAAQPEQRSGTSPVQAVEAQSGATQSVADSAAADAQKNLNEVDSLKKAELEGENALLQDTVQVANDSYNADLQRLNELKTLQSDILKQRNLLEEQSSTYQKEKVEQAYQDNLTQLEIQQKKADKAYQDQLLAQKTENTKRVLQQENRIAALGGYGDLQKGKELQSLTIENDSLLNSIVFEQDMSNKELGLQYRQVNNNYVNAIKEVELNKNSVTQKNYEDYLSYITDIEERESLTRQRKDELILSAKEKYIKSVGEINQKAFTQRYEISRDAAEVARQLKNEQKEDARINLEDMVNVLVASGRPLTDSEKKQISQLEAQLGVPAGLNLMKIEAMKSQAAAADLDIQTQIDDFGNYNVVSIDKTTGEIVNFQTLEGIGKTNMEKSAFKLEYNSQTGEMFRFDPATGEVVKVGDGGINPSQFMSGYYSEGQSNYSPPRGTVPVGDSYVPEEVLNSVLKVGQPVGWCGVYASTISTGPKVGNTWAEKKQRIVKQDNPTAGNKLLIPLAVKTDQDYGHVATVLSYDPATKNILVSESNKDGRQNRGEGLGVVTVGTYNLDDLRNKYGNNFGFTEGELKPEVAQQFSSAGVPVGSGDDVNALVAKAYRDAGKSISSVKSLNDAVATYQRTGVLPQPKEVKQVGSLTNSTVAAPSGLKDENQTYIQDLIKNIQAGVLTPQNAYKELNKISMSGSQRQLATTYFLDSASKIATPSYMSTLLEKIGVPKDLAQQFMGSNLAVQSQQAAPKATTTKSTTSKPSAMDELKSLVNKK